MNTPLVKEFNYNVPVEEVWQALTNPDQMRQWYFPQLQRFKPVVGFNFEFDDDGSEYRKEWVVTKVDEGKTLAHSWAYNGHPGCSEVAFELSSEANTTKLILTQTGLDTFSDHPHFNRGRFESGWDNLLGENLKRLLEINDNF